MSAIVFGLARQFALQLLAGLYAVWSTKWGKIALVCVVGLVAAGIVADHYLTRAYEHGQEAAREAQEAEKAKAITQAKREGDEFARQRREAAEKDAARLRAIEERQAGIRDETKSGDGVVLPADDGWLRSKR